MVDYLKEFVVYIVNRLKQDELWANTHIWYPRIYVQCV